MSAKLEITTKEVQTKTVKSKKDGKDYTFYLQEAYLHDGSTYPTRCYVPVSSPTASYDIGWYTFASDSFFVDRFGNLSLSRRFSLVSDEA